MEMIAAVILLGLLLWAMFPALGRMAGGLLVLYSLLRITAGHTDYVKRLAVGIVLWLVAHSIYAIKRRLCGSWLAMKIFRLPFLRSLAPAV